jgi:hypothetical protein
LKAFIAVESSGCVSWASNPLAPRVNAAMTKMTLHRAMFVPFLVGDSIFDIVIQRVSCI